MVEYIYQYIATAVLVAVVIGIISAAAAITGRIIQRREMRKAIEERARKVEGFRKIFGVTPDVLAKLKRRSVPLIEVERSANAHLRLLAVCADKAFREEEVARRRLADSPSNQIWLFEINKACAHAQETKKSFWDAHKLVADNFFPVREKFSDYL